MIIDTEFNTGDQICYLSGETICFSSITDIEIKISYTENYAYMVFILSDGLRITHHIIKDTWSQHIFKDKESLVKFLMEQ